MNNQEFVSELAKLRPSATFLSVRGYRNDYSEVADYNVIFHISYENALRRSMTLLENVVPSDDLEAQAKRELLSSYQKSATKAALIPPEEIDDAYTRFFDENGDYIKGVKLHTKTSVLHLYGFVNSKRILIPGQYPPSGNKRPLTKAKEKLARSLPVSKFRQFKMVPEQVDFIAVENLHLLPPE